MNVGDYPKMSENSDNYENGPTISPIQEVLSTMRSELLQKEKQTASSNNEEQYVDVNHNQVSEVDSDDEDEQSSGDANYEDEDVIQLRSDDEHLANQLEILKEYLEGTPQTELRRRYPSFSKSEINRIVHEKVRFDGSSRGGRKTLLSHGAEIALAQELRRLMDNHNILLSPDDLSKYCVALWRAEGHVGDAPKFGKGFRRWFNKRHPNLRIRDVQVPGSQQRRQEASTTGNVAFALNSLKSYINGIPASHCYSVDEFDASANDKGLGTRKLACGPSLPKHTATNKTPHVSAVPFVCLSGFETFVQMVVQGSGKGKQQLEVPQLRNGGIIYNAKGSVNSEAWITICERFAAYIDQRFGVAKVRSPPVLLLFDGYIAHENPVALAILESHGITAVRIQPNLTHLIQINDHHRINGKIQGTIREHKARLCQANGGKMVPIEDWCHCVEGLIVNTISREGVMDAARSIGIVYYDNLRMIKMDNESIEQALQGFRASGRMRDDDELDNRGKIMLRDPAYIDYLQHRIQLGDHARILTENTVKTLHEYSRQLEYERTGKLPTKLKKRAYRSAGTSRSSGGVHSLTEPSTGIAAKRLKETQQADLDLQERKKAKAEAMAATKRARQEALSLCAQVQAYRDERLAELQKVCPAVDLRRHLRVLKPYLEGTVNLAEATELLIGRLEKGL